MAFLLYRPSVRPGRVCCDRPILPGGARTGKSARRCNQPGSTHSRPASKPEEAPMPHMPGKIAFLELLKQEGVRVMFGN
ncbi:MAG TPA: hypothetical protein VFW75_01655, partial [Acetobacteraceae bacterium]|nr:hypothetical protein [Acetobacteraceae bacterium]